MSAAKPAPISAAIATAIAVPLGGFLVDWARHASGMDVRAEACYEALEFKEGVVDLLTEELLECREDNRESP